MIIIYWSRSYEAEEDSLQTSEEQPVPAEHSEDERIIARRRKYQEILELEMKKLMLLRSASLENDSDFIFFSSWFPELNSLPPSRSRHVKLEFHKILSQALDELEKQ